MEEEKQEQEKTKCLIDDIKKIVEDKLKQFTITDLDVNNLEILYKLIDIHKDIENENYWKEEKEAIKMRYNEYEEGYSGRGYGNYSRRSRDSRGRYSTRRSYRGYPEDMMEEMKEHYMNYNEGREQYGRGNYNGGEEEMIEATEGIMENITEIVKELAESDNPQVMQIIQRNAKKIMEM